MDLSESENRRSPEDAYRRTRFGPSGAPGPDVIRTLDGHIQPFRVEREIDYDAELDLANVYRCEE